MIDRLACSNHHNPNNSAYCKQHSTEIQERHYRKRIARPLMQLILGVKVIQSHC